MPGLPWYLLPIWPLTFWRIQRLKKWFRVAGGPGSQMLWGQMWNGRVVIVQLSDDLSVHPSCCFHAPVSARLKRALVAPSPPHPRHMPGSQPHLSATRATHPDRGWKCAFAGVIPDT
tara:strand:- start:568 stop:918 length:351 start_codon:yes stop_codon:yes gene_type:complete